MNYPNTKWITYQHLDTDQLIAHPQYKLDFYGRLQVREAILLIVWPKPSPYVLTGRGVLYPTGLAVWGLTESS